jgi:predicted RNA-binding Zn ribbon-like protein
LRTNDDLTDLLAESGCTPTAGGPAPREYLLARARTLRQAIRHALAALADGLPVGEESVVEVNRVLAEMRGSERLHQDGAGWRFGLVIDEPPEIVALLPIARDFAELIAEGEAARVCKCANPGCALYFYDVSRTRRRRWCAMATCGNRSKVTRYLRRLARLAP